LFALLARSAGSPTLQGLSILRRASQQEWGLFRKINLFEMVKPEILTPFAGEREGIGKAIPSLVLSKGAAQPTQQACCRQMKECDAQERNKEGTVLKKQTEKQSF
jgi:hypothetical protein